MISVPAPVGASMAYRLDPYSLEVIGQKPKSMHDVVEPTILFYHRKKGGASPSTPVTSARSQKKPRAPTGDQMGSPQSQPPVFSSPTPSKATTSPATPSVRYITVSTITNPNIALIAPFRVTPGDAVIFQANDNGGEHFGTVSHIHDANCVAPKNPEGSPIRRLIRKARSVDQEAQRNNAKEIEVVRSTITALLQNVRPGGFVPSSLSAVEWQLDRSVLLVQLAYDPLMEGDLHNLYINLVKALGTEVYIITTLSPQSSPALSDCGASSIGDMPSMGEFSC